MLGSGVMGGVMGAFANGDAQRSDARDAAEIVKALDDLREEIHEQRLFTEIATIREAQLTFLRGNGKLPDYIDVGTDLWFAAYDWHVRWQQPLTVGRDPGGRLTLQLIATQLVLRSDAQGNFMSLPYDQRG
jgi:hypothetical protein